jgi:hypothetical protein
MDFPANPAVGDVHSYTDDRGRKTNFQWDGISWNRMDDIPSPAPPRLKLRRLIWDDGRPSINPEDDEVIDARGERVGRIKRTEAVGGGHAWRWSVYGIAVTNHPPAGQATTREAAQAAFKAAWATCQPRERGA